MFSKVISNVPPPKSKTTIFFSNLKASEAVGGTPSEILLPIFVSLLLLFV